MKIFGLPGHSFREEPERPFIMIGKVPK